MFSPLYPKLSRFCDYLSTLSGGYPFKSDFPTYTDFSFTEQYSLRHKRTICLVFLQFLLSALNCLGSFASSNPDPLSFCLLSITGTYLMIALPECHSPAQYLASQNQLFRYMKRRIYHKQSDPKYQNMQLFEAGSTLLHLIYIGIICGVPLLYPNSSIQFYSIIAKLLTGNSIFFRIIKTVCYYLNAILWARIFVAFTTWERYIVHIFFAVLYLTFKTKASLPRAPTLKGCQRFREFSVMFSIVCDLYGYYLLPFAIVMTPGLVRALYFLVRNPESISISNGILLTCQAGAATGIGFVFLTIAGALNTKSAKVIRSWRLDIPSNRERVTKLSVKSCKAPVFQCSEAGLRVKRNSGGMFMFAVCRGTFRSIFRS